MKLVLQARTQGLRTEAAMAKQGQLLQKKADVLRRKLEHADASRSRLVSDHIICDAIPASYQHKKDFKPPVDWFAGHCIQARNGAVQGLITRVQLSVEHVVHLQTVNIMASKNAHSRTCSIVRVEIEQVLVKTYMHVRTLRSHIVQEVEQA
jgi:hypothetical protein